MMKVNEILEKYSDIPRSVVLKILLYRQGWRMTKTARDAVKQMDLNFKGEFMFSWDSKTGRKSLEEKVPFIMYMKRDNTLLLDRTNELSPYEIELIDGKFFICEDGEPFEEVWYEPVSPYQSKKTSDGVSMGAIAQSIGDVIFITPNKYCEFWKEGLQCKFCDIMSTTKDQAKKGKEQELGVVHRTPEQIAEALEMTLCVEGWPIQHRHAILSGGTMLTPYRGKTEVEFYVEIFKAIYKRLRKWYPIGTQLAPPDEDGCKKLFDAGVADLNPNIEVWDRDLFRILCPGKDKYIGRDQWIKRCVNAAKIFPPWTIIPSLVIGVEMAKPWGFKDVDSAVKSTIGGMEYLLEHGCLPKTSIWLPMQGSAIGDQEPAPLEYYMELGRRYKELRDKFGQYDQHTICRRCAAPTPLDFDWDYATGTWG